MNITEATLQINYAAENAHRRHITFGFGHIMLYNEKAEEAADYIAAKYPTKLAGFPLIEAEATATDRSPKKVADGIIDRRAKWVAVCAKIEHVRLKGMKTLSESGNVSKIVEDTIKQLEKL